MYMYLRNVRSADLDADELVDVWGGGGDEVHAGCEDVRLVQDAVPGGGGVEHGVAGEAQQAPVISGNITNINPHNIATLESSDNVST